MTTATTHPRTKVRHRIDPTAPAAHDDAVGQTATEPTPVSETPESHDGTAATQRAERIVDETAERIGRWTATAGHALLRWGARAREEAEDVWAEAQSIRNGTKP